MVFLVVDSSTGDLAHTGSATRGHFRPTRPPSPLLKHALVAPHGGPPEVRDGGKLTARLQGVAEAAEEVAGSLRARLAPDEVSLEFGLKVSGGVNWFFAKAQGEGTIKVTVKWAGNARRRPPQPETGPDPGKG